MVTDAFSDYVVGHGELWCAQLFAATVRRLGVDCGFMDTREVGRPCGISRTDSRQPTWQDTCCTHAPCTGR